MSMLKMAAVALAYVCLMSPVSAKAEAQATRTVTFLGIPILEASATKRGPSQDWSQSEIELKLTILSRIEPSSLVSDASSRMQSEFGLPIQKAKSFEERAAAIPALATGSVLTMVCAPNTPLTIVQSGHELLSADAETAAAFCAVWFSKEGDEALRAGLGLK